MSENSGGPIVITCPYQKEAPLNLNYFTAAFFLKDELCKRKDQYDKRLPEAPDISMIDIHIRL